MKKLTLLLCLLIVAYSGYAAEQVYFKIAVNENDYSTFLTERRRTRKKTLQYLATKMRQYVFHPGSLNRDYYTVTENRGIKYFDRDVVQYDITPVKHDRFRHVLLVDQKKDVVIRKEVYDTNGKLVFSFTSLDRESTEHVDDADSHPDPDSDAVHIAAASVHHDAFNGYFVTADRELKDGTKHISFSDGLNRFSIFRKKINTEPTEQKRILYGNYIYRKKVGKELFTVVGTIPFEEMDDLINNIVKLEEKK